VNLGARRSNSVPWGRTAQLWTGYGLMSLGLETARLVAETLFVSRVGVAYLPMIFAAQAVIRVAGSWGYLHLARRSTTTRLLVEIIAGLGLTMIVPAAATHITPALWPYAVLYGIFEGADTVVKIHWGVYLLDLYQPSEAAGLFPVLFTAAGVGRALGGAAVRELSGLLALPTILMTILAGALPLAALFFATIVPRRNRSSKQVPIKPTAPPGTIEADSFMKPRPPTTSAGLRTGSKTSDDATRRLKRPLDPLLQDGPSGEGLVTKSVWADEQALVARDTAQPSGRKPHLVAAMARCRRSRLCRNIALATVLLVAIRMTIRLVVLTKLRASLDERALAELLGTYSAMAHVAALLLQLFVTPAIAKRKGIEAANVTFALGLGVGAVTFTLWPTVIAALTARFFIAEFKSAIKTPISAIFYYGEPFGDRAGARAVVLGVVSPLAAVITSAVLQSVAGIATLSSLSIAAALLSGFYLAAVWAQNRAYRSATTASGPPIDAES